MCIHKVAVVHYNSTGFWELEIPGLNHPRAQDLELLSFLWPLLTM